MEITKKEKVVLLLLPFWTPQIPPLGISCLKSYLEPRGYDVKTFDFNVEEDLRKIYNTYFNTLRGYVAENKQGNFYNIGHEVLQNHLMAHLHQEDENRYHELVRELIRKTFYIRVDESQTAALDRIIRQFYAWLAEMLVNLLEKQKPAVLGISVYKGTVPASMFAFKLTREQYPRVKTVMGGAVFSQVLGKGTPDFEFFLEKTKDYIDKIIIGEGEQLFFKLLAGELPESRRVFTLEDLGNLGTGPLDLAAAPLPDFSGLNTRYYPNLAAYSSRSCPYQCSFCSETVYWGKYRKKNAGQVVKELIELYKTYQSQLFLMCDSLLNPVITDLAREFTNTEISIYWDGYLRVDKHVCDADRVRLWRRGGFYRARLGIESGSKRILEMMNKDIDIPQTRTAIFNLAHAGIKTTTYWIIGFPGETEEDFRQTLDLVEELRDDIYEAECNPFGYYWSGQVDSDKWSQTYKRVPLYPEDARDMLVFQTWRLDCQPSREETFDRISRFVEHCARLGIANPYSLYDIYNADERWRKLHPNAVPSLVEFKNNAAYIDECRHLKDLSFLHTDLEDEKDFQF